MMQGKAFCFLRIVAPLALALSLALAFAPSAFATATTPRQSLSLVGPKAYYMAIGDSLAFGYQPDLNWDDGYSNYFYSNLKSHGVTDYDNLACPGETTSTMINGGCPYSALRKYLYIGPQLKAAVNYLHNHAGQVSPVTLDIGANDLIPDLNTSNCSISSNWETDLAAVDHNLTSIILPQLVAAMTVNGHVTGDLLLMNYYDPYQNICPNTVPYIQEINQHLARDASGYATIVDVFTPFGGATTPDPNTCTYTWMCSIFKDIHAKDAGYSVMASAFEKAAGY
jgi:lysophospholipase L1-like esterase